MARHRSRDPRDEGDPGRYSYDGLDRVLHERARLGILASLAAHHEGLLFNDLKTLCALTDGNLSRHLAVLGDAGLVEIGRDVTGARPQTKYRLSASGQRRFEAYIAELEKVVMDARRDTEAHARVNRSRGTWAPA